MSAVTLGALARSAVYVNAAQLWQMASRLVLTPVIISALGLEAYGAWALVLGLCSSVSAIDVGAGWVYAKVTAELDAQRDYGRLSEIISSGLALVGGIAACGLTALWLAHTWVLPVLGVPEHLLREAGHSLAVLSAAVVFGAGCGCVLHVLAGLQRMDLKYRFIIFGSIAEFATALALLATGAGMVALPIGLLTGEVVSIGFARTYCRRLRPALVLSPLRASMRGVQQVVGLGMRFEGLVLLSTAFTQGIRVLISSLYGTSVLGIFHLADRLLSVGSTPGLAVVSPLMPAFANLGQDTERWRRLFLHASKALGVAAALPLVFAAVFAGPILFAWTGQHFPEAAWTVRILAPVEFLALLTGVAAARLRAAGMVGLEMRSSLLGGMLGLFGLAAAFPFAGYAGSVVAVACGRSIGSLWFLNRFASFGKLGRSNYLASSVFAPLLLFAPVGLLLGAAAFALPILNADAGTRAGVLCTLAPLATVYGLICTALAWFLGFTAAERAGIVRFISRGQPIASRGAELADGLSTSSRG